MEESNQIKKQNEDCQIVTDEYDRGWDCLDQEDYEGAKSHFENALHAGITEAYCELGNLYFEGKGFEKDYKKAFAYYKKGVAFGDANCLANMAMCYFWGNGVQTDLQKSAFFMEKAASMDCDKAMFEMALNYENGYGVSQNIDKAIEWLRKAAEKDYAIAWFELGNIYFSGKYVTKDLEKAFEYYEKGAEAGYCASKLMLADFYKNGISGSKDLNKATKLYQEAYDDLYEAAVNNDTDAQFRMGAIFYSGLPLINIPQDYVQAVEWYRKAGVGGHYHAQNNLGNMYLFGLGVVQNYEKAQHWFSLAAERLEVTALSNLGNLYYLGRGVEQDYAKAAEYHSKAAHLGYPNSQAVLGDMYLNGQGVERNESQAVAWLEKAAARGTKDAYTKLGYCYMKGIGFEQDDQKAFCNFQKAAELGDLEGHIYLAKCYIKGKGTQKSPQKAYNILQQLCDDEARYEEERVSIIEYTTQVEDAYTENPLDSENLRHYATAFYLLAMLTYHGSGTDRSPSKAIRLLRWADRLGYADELQNNESPAVLIKKIEQEVEENEINDTTKSYIEVRKSENLKSGWYDVYIHHANGTESLVEFQGRNKFVYILGLLIAHERHSVAGLTTRHFSYMRDTLIELAGELRVDKDDWGRWIDEFVYIEKDDNVHLREERGAKTYGCFSLDRSKYSNALSAAKRAVLAATVSNEEFETFCLRAKGGQNSIALISADSSQIVIPDTLSKYLDILPTMKEIENYRASPTKYMEIKRE